MQYGGRREREKKEHEEYEERQQRVSERKQANWKKEQEAGWTCSLEQCGKHFADVTDFYTHVSEHKKDMEKRMVCNQDKCGQRFSNSRDFSSHVAGHRKALRTKLINSVRSVLLYNKHGLLIESFEREFKGMIGKTVPYKPLGFTSVYEMVTNLPDVVAVQELDGGHKLLVAVPDEKTAHMARMVGSQRENDEGFNRVTRDVLRSQGEGVFRNINRLAGRGKRKVSTHAQEQVKELLNMDENRRGLDLMEFQRIYNNEFGYRVDFRDLGFYSLEDFVYHGLSNCAHLMLDSTGLWKVKSLKDEYINVPWSSVQDVSSVVMENIAILLSTRPDGIEISSLPMVYSLYGDLDPRQMGFEDMVEFCLFMPNVCTVTVDGKEFRVMPSVSNMTNKCQVNVPDWVERNIKRVLFKYPDGVITSQLLNYYIETIGGSLFPINLGFPSLHDLLNCLDGKLVNIDFPGDSNGRVTLHKHCKDMMAPPIGGEHDKNMLLLNQLSSSGIKQVVIHKSQWVKVLRYGPPGYVVIRPQGSELNELEDQMERQITRELTGVEIRSEELVVGLLVAALYVDKCWHRAVVVRVMEQEKMAEIRYIDHCLRSKVRADSLRRLSCQFGGLPAQAVGVQLTGATSASCWNTLRQKQEMGWLKIDGDDIELLVTREDLLVSLNTQLTSEEDVSHTMDGHHEGHMEKIDIQIKKCVINGGRSGVSEDLKEEDQVTTDESTEENVNLKTKVFECLERLKKGQFNLHEVKIASI